MATSRLNFKRRENMTIRNPLFPKFVMSLGNSPNNITKNLKKKENMETTDSQNETIFPLGNLGPANWFSGEVHVQTLVSPEQIEGLYTVGQVTFGPGGRTYWHTHPVGQVLLVTEGKGWYQERGKLAQVLTKGTTITIPKGVEHWHGASADHKMVHIAISNIVDGNSVTWINPVTREEYAEVNKE